MARKKWIVKNADKALAKELAEECGINQLVSLILLSRGMTDPVDIDEFLTDELYFSDPFDLPDMEKAVERIEQAKQNKERIAVCGPAGIALAILLATVVGFLFEMSAAKKFPKTLATFNLNLLATFSSSNF